MVSKQGTGKKPKNFHEKSKDISRYFLQEHTLIWISLERSFPPAELEYR